MKILEEMAEKNMRSHVFSCKGSFLYRRSLTDYILFHSNYTKDVLSKMTVNELEELFDDVAKSQKLMSS